eukprot:gene3597-10103_t
MAAAHRPRDPAAWRDAGDAIVAFCRDYGGFDWARDAACARSDGGRRRRPDAGSAAAEQCQ